MFGLGLFPGYFYQTYFRSFKQLMRTMFIKPPEVLGVKPENLWKEKEPFYELADSD